MDATEDTGQARDPAPPSLHDVEASLNAVEAALDRLRAGTYGRCESCGSALGDEWLAEQPTARRCPRCAPRVAG